MKLSAKTAAIVLALAAAAGVVVGRERPSTELPARPAAQGARETAAPAEIDLARLERREASTPRSDPFAAVSFEPAPRPAKERAQAPQAPSAPPLPFTYFGRLTQNGATEVFVMRGEELISVAAGQRIGDEYRVDAVSDTNIAFTYLPLKARQSLELEAGG